MPIFVCAPYSAAYTSRTFCAFELHCQDWSQKEMVVAQNFATREADMITVCENVDTESAQTRDPVQQELIQMYIALGGGFDGLDQVVRDALMQAVRREVRRASMLSDISFGSALSDDSDSLLSDDVSLGSGADDSGSLLSDDSDF